MGSLFWHSALITITSRSPGESVLLPEPEEHFPTLWWAPVQVVDTPAWALLGIVGTCLAGASQTLLPFVWWYEKGQGLTVWLYQWGKLRHGTP